MAIYGLLSRLFPTSFTAKVFFLAFIGTHVPLIALLAWALMPGRMAGADGSDVLLLVLAATLVGTAATLWALQQVLKPVYRIEAAMRSFEETGAVPDLPLDSRDELGRLMQRAQRLMRRARQRLDETQLAADTDPLTEALNRRGFDRRVAQMRGGVVVHLDLDHFKSINDSFGHDVGDEVLRRTAEVVRRNLRAGDLFARFGGEEFVAFLPDATRAQGAATGERLRAAIAAEVRVGDRAVTASIGVACGRAAVCDLLRQADEATYVSKREGRNRVTLREIAVPAAAG